MDERRKSDEHELSSSILLSSVPSSPSKPFNSSKTRSRLNPSQTDEVVNKAITDRSDLFAESTDNFEAAMLGEERDAREGIERGEGQDLIDNLVEAFHTVLGMQFLSRRSLAGSSLVQKCRKYADFLCTLNYSSVASQWTKHPIVKALLAVLADPKCIALVGRLSSVPGILCGSLAGSLPPHSPTASRRHGKGLHGPQRMVTFLWGSSLNSLLGFVFAVAALLTYAKINRFHTHLAANELNFQSIVGLSLHQFKYGFSHRAYSRLIERRRQLILAGDDWSRMGQFYNTPTAVHPDDHRAVQMAVSQIVELKHKLQFSKRISTLQSDALMINDLYHGLPYLWRPLEPHQTSTCRGKIANQVDIRSLGDNAQTVRFVDIDPFPPVFNVTQFERHFAASNKEMRKKMGKASIHTNINYLVKRQLAVFERLDSLFLNATNSPTTNRLSPAIRETLEARATNVAKVREAFLELNYWLFARTIGLPVSSGQTLRRIINTEIIPQLNVGKLLEIEPKNNPILYPYLPKVLQNRGTRKISDYRRRLAEELDFDKKSKSTNERLKSLSLMGRLQNSRNPRIEYMSYKSDPRLYTSCGRSNGKKIDSTLCISNASSTFSRSSSVLVDYYAPLGNLSSILLQHKEKVLRSYSLVISSHIVQKQTDLIRHFQSLQNLVMDGGYYVMEVPDKRYNGAYYIPETTLAVVLEHFYAKPTKHVADPGLENRRPLNSKAFLESQLLKVSEMPEEIWKGHVGPQPLLAVSDDRRIFKNYETLSKSASLGNTKTNITTEGVVVIDLSDHHRAFEQQLSQTTQGVDAIQDTSSQLDEETTSPKIELLKKSNQALKDYENSLWKLEERDFNTNKDDEDRDIIIEEDDDDDFDIYHFTPNGMAFVIDTLYQLKLIDFHVHRLYETIHNKDQFTIILKRCAQG